jgi:putative cell wall-binding protein
LFLSAIRRSTTAAVVVLIAGMAFAIAVPNAEAAGGPVLNVLSASRVCPDSTGFFHLDVTVTGDVPNATRTLLANVGQSLPAFTEPGLDINSQGDLPLTSVVLANQADVQVLTSTTVTIELVAYADPTQTVLAHTTIVLPSCNGPTVETVSCTDHSQTLGSPTCIGAPDANYSQYVQLAGGLGTGVEENSYTYTARPGYEVVGASALVDDTPGDLMNGDGSSPDPNPANPAALGPGDRVIGANDVRGTIETYITQLTVSFAVYPGSFAGPWTSAPPAPTVTRVFGADRMGTAVAISTTEYPTGGAGAVVLARADAYPDALVGAPLAASVNAPLLLTSGATLPDSTMGELQRVLAPGKTVYLLGGTASIPDSVSAELTTLGYVVVRYGGIDRYGTAVAVADALNDPATVLLASGLNFPDALTAGPAAARLSGAVLLTDGTHLPASISSYLSAHATTTYAIGGAAAAADSSAVAIVGADRYATAEFVAQRFFRNPTFVGIAVGSNFPDALAAGAYLAHRGAPLLLTGAGDLSSSAKELLVSARPSVDVFGGPGVIADTVITAAAAATA